MNNKRKLVLAAPNMLLFGAHYGLERERRRQFAGHHHGSAGAAVPGAKVTATETATAVKRTIAADGRGFYSFQNLPVGRYNVDVQASGFQPLRRTGVEINVDSKVVVDATLAIGERSEAVTVSESAAQVETVDTQMGEVITAKQMTAVPLNGRSFTDLLSLQSGVAPVTSLTAETQQDVGVSAFSPSGDLNPGTISINGQREFANSFVLNGSDVEEDVNMGAAIVPNLDSIAEFRILTSNFDAEYGEFSGGQIEVVTKSGDQRISRRWIRVPAQYRSRRPQLFFAHPRRLRPKPVRRDLRRPDHEEQSIFLLGLPGNAVDAGHRHGRDSRSLAGRKGRRLRRFPGPWAVCELLSKELATRFARRCSFSPEG